MKKLFLLIIPVLLMLSCNKSFNKVLKSKDFDYKLEMADKYYAAKKYSRAQQLYVELFTVFKGTDKFEDLYYKYAYCAYYLKDYVNAENLFKDFLGVFPNSQKAEEMAYMQAYTFYLQSPKPELDQANTLKARDMMLTFINNYPNSARVKEAQEIVVLCRKKQEVKDYKSAELYFNIGQYQAAGIYFNNMVNDYPDSESGDQYLFMALKSNFEFASKSISDKQEDRYEKVVSEYFDFVDRYPDSKYLKDAENLKALSEKNIKQLKNEQVNKTASR